MKRLLNSRSRYHLTVVGKVTEARSQLRHSIFIVIIIALIFFQIPLVSSAAEEAAGDITDITFSSSYKPGDTVQVYVHFTNPTSTPWRYLIAVQIFDPSNSSVYDSHPEGEDISGWVAGKANPTWGPFEYTLPSNAPSGNYHVLASLRLYPWEPALDWRGLDWCPPEETFEVEANQPDLVISYLSPQVIDVDSGEPFSVSTKVKNQGSATAGSSTLGWYWSTSPSSHGSLVYSTSVGSLGAGSTSGTITHSFTYECVEPETVYIFTRADRTNAVSESDDNNNYSDDNLSPGYVTVNCDCKPGDVSVATYSATSVGETQATLRGAITDFNNNPSAEIRFRYRVQGTTTWSYTGWVTRTTTATYPELVTGLSSDTTYEFQAEGRGSVDTTIMRGDILTFTTSEEPSQPPTAYIDSISPDPATQGTDTVSFTGHGTDSDGSVVAYRWVSSMDGQLSTSSSFSKPASELSVGTHTIYFEVQDDDGAWSTLDSETLTISVIIPEWRKHIEVGDILLHRDSWLIHCLIGQEMTHAGIYVGDGWVVESLVADANDDCSNGVAKHRIECWDYPNDSCVELRRVGSATIAQRIAAAEWAIEQTERDPLPGFTDLATVLQGIVSCEGKQSAPVSETWYCTELVWASYYNQGVDLDHSDWGSCVSIVTPDELRESTYLVAEHTKEECLDCLGWLKIEARCPVELRVTDPEELTISKESNEISGAMYVVFDSDEDGDPSKIIGIPEPKPGDYYIEVIPETDASPTDTYGLIASVGDSSMVLAEDTSVADIPDVPYILTVTIPGGLPGLPCFIATATYGTPMADEVQTLRDFRDEYLLTNPLGQTITNLYYQFSPPIAEFITDHPSLKPIMRIGLVPAVAISAVAVSTNPTERMVMIGLSVLVSVAVAVWVSRRQRRDSEYTWE